MKKTKTLKANPSQITYVRIGENDQGLPNLAFAFVVRAGKICIFQTQPQTYEVEVYGQTEVKQ